MNYITKPINVLGAEDIPLGAAVLLGISMLADIALLVGVLAYTAIHL